MSLPCSNRFGGTPPPASTTAVAPAWDSRSFGRSLRRTAAASVHRPALMAGSRSGCSCRPLESRSTTPQRRRQHRDLERSEEHTSELQSQFHLVCRLLLEKKKKHEILTCSRCPPT